MRALVVVALAAAACDPCCGHTAPGNVTLRTQDDVEALRGVLCVEDDLNVGDGDEAAFVGSSGILDLAPLAELIYVDGDLSVLGNAALQSLDGLDGVVEIGRRIKPGRHDVRGNLNVVANPSLRSLGLASLVVVHGCTQIVSNPTLSDGEVEALFARVTTEALPSSCGDGQPERSVDNGQALENADDRGAAGG